MIRTCLLASLCAAAACGSSSGDDEPPADAPPDIDNGTCGAALRFTGEHIDWDSGTNFCGIFDARFTVRGTGATDATAPNGRFDTCVPDQAVTLVDVAPPATMSACNGMPDLYTLPAVAVVRKDVIVAGGAWSSRAFTAARQPTAAGLAHVYVHVVGEARRVSLGITNHGDAQAIQNNAWQNGAVGNDVFFPDIVTSGDQETTLTIEGGAIGAGTIPLVANAMTMITVVAN